MFATFCPALFAQAVEPYSTCPPTQQMMKRNVGYVEVGTRELMSYAKVKIQPEKPLSCRCKGQVRVMVMVEGQRVFCAAALDGHPLLQKAAVDAAMKWKFKRERPEFRSEIYGVLIFEFDD